MEAKELRIGNLIKCNKRFAKGTYVITKDSFAQIIDDEIQNSVLYEPIPLTEEWLLKFGFRDTTTTLTKNLMSESNDVSLYQMPNGKYFANGPICDVYLDSVHKLQNLYFALTNQELEIKEPILSKQE